MRLDAEQKSRLLQVKVFGACASAVGVGVFVVLFKADVWSPAFPILAVTIPGSFLAMSLGIAGLSRWKSVSTDDVYEDYKWNVSTPGYGLAYGGIMLGLLGFIFSLLSL